MEYFCQKHLIYFLFCFRKIQIIWADIKETVSTQLITKDYKRNIKVHEKVLRRKCF